MLPSFSFQALFGGTALTNPMTAAGDLIVGGSAGAPSRLPIGSNGQVPTIVAGAIVWQTPSGGGSPAGALSLADLAGSSDLVGSISGTAGGNFTLGSGFFVTAAASVTGVRFRWLIATSRTVRVSIWDVSGNTELAHVNVSTTGAGVYTGTFGAAQAITANKRYIVSMWETSGTDYSLCHVTTAFGSTSPVFPLTAGNGLFYTFIARYDAGQTLPTSNPGADFLYPVEPIF